MIIHVYSENNIALYYFTPFTAVNICNNGLYLINKRDDITVCIDCDKQIALTFYTCLVNGANKEDLLHILENIFKDNIDDILSFLIQKGFIE